MFVCVCFTSSKSQSRRLPTIDIVMQPRSDHHIWFQEPRLNLFQLRCVNTRYTSFTYSDVSCRILRGVGGKQKPQWQSESDTCSGELDERNEKGHGRFVVPIRACGFCLIVYVVSVQCKNLRGPGQLFAVSQLWNKPTIRKCEFCFRDT